MVIAKSLKQAFTCRDAEAESGQDLTKPIYTHPNIKCSRDNFAEKRQSNRARTSAELLN